MSWLLGEGWPAPGRPLPLQNVGQKPYWSPSAQLAKGELLRKLQAALLLRLAQATVQSATQQIR